MEPSNTLAAISGSGLGVRPVIFFQDSQKLASAQEKGVIVCYCVLTNDVRIFIAL